jgi:hypothetical protein
MQSSSAMWVGDPLHALDASLYTTTAIITGYMGHTTDADAMSRSPEYIYAYVQEADLR